MTQKPTLSRIILLVVLALMPLAGCTPPRPDEVEVPITVPPTLGSVAQSNLIITPTQVMPAIETPTPTADRPQPTPTRGIVLSPTPRPALEVGMTLPDLMLTFDTGENQSLWAYQDKVMLLNVSGAWCAPCVSTLREFNDVMGAYTPEALQVMAIMTHNTPKAVAGLRTQYELNFALVIDSEDAFAKVYDIELLPTTLIVTPDHVIREILVGSKTHQEMIEAVEPWLEMS